MSPLSAACTLRLIAEARAANSIQTALRHEYRFTYRSAEHGDFIEGIRAAIIDKDRTPHWRHASAEQVTDDNICLMLAPLGDADLTL